MAATVDDLLGKARQAAANQQQARQAARDTAAAIAARAGEQQRSLEANTQAVPGSSPAA